MFFPFDIINFDPYGNLLNPDLDSNKLYQALKNIFELQEQIDNFLLFVTTPIFDIHSDTKSRLRRTFECNVSSYTKIRAALESSLATSEYDNIDVTKRIAIGFAKSVVISVAKSEGWNHKHYGIFVYERAAGGKLLSSVIQFSKAHGSSDESLYIQDIIRIIDQMPQCYPYRESCANQEVKGHLQKVIEFREKSRKEYIKTS